MSTLCLELQPSGTAVLFRVPDERAGDLRKLSGRFLTARHQGPTLVELELEDLLANLRELSEWPSQDVEWQPELRLLVETSLQDTLAASRQLERPEAPPLSPAEINDVLYASGWCAPEPLTTFQLRDIAKLLCMSHGANFSVPGSGKTRVALATFQVLRAQAQVERILVVAPKAAYESWQLENAVCFSKPLHVQVLDRCRVDPAAELIVVNYEGLVKHQVSLARWLTVKPSMFVLDEAHRMKKGADGVHGAACLALGPRAHRRLILTGTPAPNGAKDLESLLGFVWPGEGRRIVTRAIGNGDLRHASTVLRPLFTRTTKSELGLPKVKPTIRRIELPDLHREIYAALIGEMSVRAAQVAHPESQESLEALGRVMMYLLMAATSPALLAVGDTKYEALRFRVPPLDVPGDASLYELLQDLPSYELSPKYQETLAIVDANAKAGRKTLVWSTFVRNLTTLKLMLTPYRPALVHGGTSDRVDQLKRFRKDPDCHVLLSNPATLGEGVSLHKDCHDAVYVDRDFAAGRYLQSLDRIHRLGLKPGTITNITVLSATNTIDDVVEQRLETKLRFMEAVLDDPAVGQLADLDEEPAAAMQADMAALLEHLNVLPAS
ncbi:DEAD/DEAH box helicase [Actinomadura kijaniata]|uniref:DEAD/DEAH box helicase n=1 Tax=Actinomadura kijaniata TaxID=46161 RepID=UPI00082DD737|nr:DEAD/DEAH box helicase [Actinomadura kijaniata]